MIDWKELKENGDWTLYIGILLLCGVIIYFLISISK